MRQVLQGAMLCIAMIGIVGCEQAPSGEPGFSKPEQDRHLESIEALRDLIEAACDIETTQDAGAGEVLVPGLGVIECRSADEDSIRNSLMVFEADIRRGPVSCSGDD